MTQARFLLSSFPMLKASFEAICTACGTNSGVKRQRGDPHAHSAPRIKLEGRDDDVSNAIANPAPVAVHSSSWEMQQTSSGGSFWRHTVTGETSWQCPPGHMASDAAASKTRSNDQQSRFNPQRHQHRHPRQCARPSTQLSPPSCNPPVRSTRASNNIESYKPPFMCSK